MKRRCLDCAHWSWHELPVGSASLRMGQELDYHRHCDCDRGIYLRCSKTSKPKARLVSASTPVPASAPRLIGRLSTWTQRSHDGEPPALGRLSPRVETVRRRD